MIKKIIMNYNFTFEDLVLQHAHLIRFNLKGEKNIYIFKNHP